MLTPNQPMKRKKKPLYRYPIACLLIYLVCIFILLLLPAVLWIKSTATICLSILIVLVWQLNYKHLNAHREELRMVSDNIEDPMWSLKPNGIVEWMNPAFMEIFHADENQKYTHYQKIIKVNSVLDFIQTFLINQTVRMREIMVEDHYYLITGSYNKDAKRFVFIMQNINVIRQTEKMKQDFMVNVAHELRTPLTAIKGFTLALEEDFSPDNKRFLKIIKNHTDRLIKLISDFQTLAKLERMPELELQSINLQTFMDNIIDIYHQTFKQSGLYLEYQQEPEHISIEVDPFKFEQIFINLIDNALHYTTAGGIRITSRAIGKELKISVQDTGSGISQEHLPRIFERFYVADPSRNKKISGTGLGLAIVKHTVILHQGKIEASSTPGSGTCFTMTFPLKQNK
ncbi:MAG TPA: ATP-binding protein [Candidatus Cloacimonadota bacterium]|nr:ATP-binding protein [Candidatus Cloacimonadota bacterium]